MIEMCAQRQGEDGLAEQANKAVKWSVIFCTQALVAAMAQTSPS
jgi:hypothetical protein